MDGVNIQGPNQTRASISVWRVYLPSDVDREMYIKTCYLTGTITLINEYSEIKHRVRIGRLNLQLVALPTDLKSFGSEVICVTQPNSQKIYVIDVLASAGEFYDQQENQFSLYKIGDG